MQSFNLPALLQMTNTTKLKYAKGIMFLAALYNIFWGLVISAYPQILLFGNPPTDFLLIILRCVGMLVGVYGIAYYFASRDPNAYWPLILVGWIGKLLGRSVQFTTSFWAN